MDTNEIIGHSQHIESKAPCVIMVGTKVYSVKQISNTVRRKISILEKRVLLYEQEAENEVSWRKVKRIDRTIRTLHSKTAAYYLLGNCALFIPFLWCITWHILDLRDSEHTFRINEAGMNNRGVDFFLANWQITKAQLALSMRLVGDGIKQYQEKMENVENMLEKDAFGIKEENK